jgi:putative oxidoreductase
MTTALAEQGTALKNDGKNVFRKVMRTDNNIASTIIRVTLGVVFFAHGAQKVFGWFGGPGPAGAIRYFAGMRIPKVFAYLAIGAEFCGSLGLIFGLLTRVASLGIAANMIVAIAKVHMHFGFFMNWHNEQEGEGIEYHILVLSMIAFLMMQGAGALSLDKILSGGSRTEDKA